MHEVLLTFALVAVAIGPSVDAVAMLEVSFIFALVVVAIGPSVGAMAVFLAIDVAALVTPAIGPGVDAPPMLGVQRQESFLKKFFSNIHFF